jgi:hypothetical protein
MNDIYQHNEFDTRMAASASPFGFAFSLLLLPLFFLLP